MIPSQAWHFLGYGPVVKRLRHRPFTAVTGVRVPSGSPFGRLAQLGEHLPYKQGVGSSSLSSPTITKTKPAKMFCRLFVFLACSGYNRPGISSRLVKPVGTRPHQNSFAAPSPRQNPGIFSSLVGTNGHCFSRITTGF